MTLSPKPPPPPLWVRGVVILFSQAPSIWFQFLFFKGGGFGVQGCSVLGISGFRFWGSGFCGFRGFQLRRTLRFRVFAVQDSLGVCCFRGFRFRVFGAHWACRVLGSQYLRP